MTTVRISRVWYAGVDGGTRLRISRVWYTGSDKVGQKIRISRVWFSGVDGLRLLSLPNITITPENLVTYTAQTVGNITPDSWTHRVVSNTGDEVLLTGTGATRSFYAPSSLPGSGATGATCTIGVLATLGGVPTAEVLFTVSTFPQSSWFLHPTKGALGGTGRLN